MAEEAFQPNWFSKPGDTLANLMERKALSPSDIADLLGRNTEIVYGLLAGTVAIDESIANQLANNVGGSPSFWTTRQTQFEESLDRAAETLTTKQARAWLKSIPLKDMMEAGWIASSKDINNMVKFSLLFFDVVDPDEWRARYTAFSNIFSFRTSPSFESKMGAVAAWLRKGEIQASTIPCGPWSPDKLRARLSDIRVLTKAKNPDYFIPKLRTVCAELGIAIVFVRAPSGCKASGAARFLSNSKGMIILSFRHLSDDHFWFSFFHEIGHLLLHEEGQTFIDGDDTDQSQKEIEANTFAGGVLIPAERRDELLQLRPRSTNVIRFATSIGTSPGIVVGQMQHLGILARNQLNHLKRRYTWEQLAAVCS